VSHSVQQQAAAGVGTRPAVNRLPERLCRGVARSFMNGSLARFSLRRRALGDRFESQEKYVQDRISNVETYQQLFSEFGAFSGKTVLELGCSSGYLLAALLERERFRALGADTDAQALARGHAAYGGRIVFLPSTPSSIPLPDGSVDVIYTVDTVEHLSQPRDIFADCHRILRPGGMLLSHFTPWFGPWGSHLEDIISFPWAHVVFSMDTLLNVAADLYDSEDYVPACYWFDSETGARRPNPYVEHEHWREFLNQITIRQFVRILRTLPFHVVQFRRLGFGGRAYSWARGLRALAQVPLLDEFLCSAVFCALQKPR
jgi:SAM-dependent methyltransferase